MKKNIKLTLVAICMIATSVYGLKANCKEKPFDAEMVLSENVEALSSNAEIGIGYEVQYESPCPAPFEYKVQRVCQVSIKDRACTASDCF